MGDRWLIRLATGRDLHEIAAAERVCFSDPWSVDGIAELLQSGTSVSLVAVENGSANRLAGYLFARTVAGEGEILNLAVLPEARRQGLARRLLDTALGHLAARNTDVVFLEVRASNEEAKSLYQSAGFSVVGVRASYYRRPREDALVLRRAAAPVEK